MQPALPTQGGSSPSLLQPPPTALTSVLAAGAVFVRRHSDHAGNLVVVRHNPHRSELPRLPAVADAKKAAAQVGARCTLYAVYC